MAVLDREETIPKPKKGKRKKDSPALADNFKTMLTGVFALAGARNPIWLVDETELDMVVEPAARIFERYVSEKSDEIADIFLLLMALSIMLIPRIMLTMVKRGGKTGEHQVREVRAGDAPANREFTHIIPGTDPIAG